MNETFLREAREIFDAIEKLPQEEQWENLQEFFSALIHLNSSRITQ